MHRLVPSAVVVFGLAAAACAACAPDAPPRDPASTAPRCPAGTQPVHEGDSDVGWGEVEESNACELPDGVLQGPAIEIVASAPGRAPTELVGSYAGGRRVGTWTQRDERGATLGAFTLDASGSGTETIRDQLGHARSGRVDGGRRVGAWSYRDRDGTVVATDTWVAGSFVKRSGAVAWDPSMIDPADVCPATPPSASPVIDEDGCPSPPPP